MMLLYFAVVFGPRLVGRERKKVKITCRLDHEHVGFEKKKKGERWPVSEASSFCFGKASSGVRGEGEKGKEHIRFFLLAGGKEYQGTIFAIHAGEGKSLRWVREGKKERVRFHAASSDRRGVRWPFSSSFEDEVRPPWSKCGENRLGRSTSFPGRGGGKKRVAVCFFAYPFSVRLLLRVKGHSLLL